MTAAWTANGNGYPIVRFAGVTIAQATGSSATMNISVQPTAVADPTALGGSSRRYIGHTNLIHRALLDPLSRDVRPRRLHGVGLARCKELSGYPRFDASQTVKQGMDGSGQLECGSMRVRGFNDPTM